MAFPRRPLRSTARLALSLPWLAALAALAAPAAADWRLDPARSHLAFVSIKAGHTGEVNTFTTMSGRIDGEGDVEISLPLDSVETLIPIRNERMRELLFDTTNYAEATLTAKVDHALIAGMAPGEIAALAAEGVLSLHGERQPMVFLLQVAKVADGTIMAANIKPVIVDAEKFGMTDGLERLRELAGLESISKAVPVSFVLTFIEEAPQ